MNQMTVEYPDTLSLITSQNTEELEQEMRLALAMKMFELGRWSSGQAAAVAQLSRVEFLLACPRYRVDSVSWDDEFHPYRIHN